MAAGEDQAQRVIGHSLLTMPEIFAPGSSRPDAWLTGGPVSATGIYEMVKQRGKQAGVRV
jgi:hypothetical protein